MRAGFRSVAIVAIVVLVSISMAWAKDNWVGSWKLDVAASKFSPGPAPKSMTVKFEPAKQGIKLTSHTVDAEGVAKDGEYVSKFDGTDVPWKGNADADTAAAQRVDDITYTNTWKKAGVVTIEARCVVSADGKTLTITQVGKDAKGRPVDNHLVLQRH